MLPTAEIDAVEDRLARAQVAHDVAELDALLHDDLAYTGPDGSSGGKADDLAAHRARAYTLTRFDVIERRYDALAPGAVAARVRMAVESDLGDGEMLYTRVWTRDTGAWRVRVAHLAFLPA